MVKENESDAPRSRRECFAQDFYSGLHKALLVLKFTTQNGNKIFPSHSLSTSFAEYGPENGMYFVGGFTVIFLYVYLLAQHI